MKLTLISKLLIPILFIFMGVSLNAQENIADFIYKKDFAALQSRLDEEIDLCIMDDTQINSKEEVIARIKAFLTNYNIQSVEPLHKGKGSQEKSNYKVYKFSTAKGPVRVFVYFEMVGGKTIIKEMRFDKF